MRLAPRDDKRLPVVERTDAWGEQHWPPAPPRSPLGEALTYAHSQRRPLRAFLTDPQLPVDNSAAERALRIVAVGRKSFLLLGHDETGQNLAVLQTLCRTCVLHGVNPYEHIRDAAVRVRRYPSAAIDELLPMNWQPRASRAHGGPVMGTGGSVTPAVNGAADGACSLAIRTGGSCVPEA